MSLLHQNLKFGGSQRRMEKRKQRGLWEHLRERIFMGVTPGQDKEEDPQDHL